VLAIALGLLVSVCWGVSDFLGGLKSRSLPVVVVLCGVYAAALIVSAGAVLIMGEPTPSVRTIAAALTAVPSVSSDSVPSTTHSPSARWQSSLRSLPVACHYLYW
jgi:hypothetical protein